MNTFGEPGEYLELSAALVAGHVDKLRRELRSTERLGLGRLRHLADLEDQLADAIWLMTKLTVAELAVARAEAHGRLQG